MRILSGADVRAACDMRCAIEAMREAFGALSSGGATVPLRTAIETMGGVSLFMPAYLHRRRVAGAKVVSVSPGNVERDLPAIHAVVIVLDATTGVPTALMDGTWLTALRTGAAGGLAADLLARPDASVVALYGAGVQARTQLEAVRCVRSVEAVRVVSRTRTSAVRLARELTGVDASVPDRPDDALEGADIVIAATSSATPVFDGTQVAPGTHVTAIGSYTPGMREVDVGLLSRARIFVDQREAALAEAGDLACPIAEGDLSEGDIVGEIGEIVLDRIQGRRSPEDITYFKSVGNAVQDVAVASHVLERAMATGRGLDVEL